MLYDIVLSKAVTNIEECLAACGNTRELDAFHLIVPCGTGAFGIEHKHITETDNPWGCLKTQNIVCVEESLRFPRFWASCLLNGLNRGWHEYCVVPSLSKPHVEKQRSLLELSSPRIWSKDDEWLDIRMSEFNRTCHTEVEAADDVDKPVWAARRKGPPPWERPTAVVRSVIVDNR